MKITAKTFGTRNYIELRPDGVEYCETVAFGGKRFFRFDQIDAVLRGPQILAFQVDTETFSIPINPDNAEHRAFAERLAWEARQTVRKL